MLRPSPKRNTPKRVSPIAWYAARANCNRANAPPQQHHLSQGIALDKKKILNNFPTISGCFVLGCQCFVARIYCDRQHFYWAARLVFGNKRGNK